MRDDTEVELDICTDADSVTPLDCSAGAVRQYVVIRGYKVGVMNKLDAILATTGVENHWVVKMNSFPAAYRCFLFEFRIADRVEMLGPKTPEERVLFVAKLRACLTAGGYSNCEGDFTRRLPFKSTSARRCPAQPGQQQQQNDEYSAARVSFAPADIVDITPSPSELGETVCLPDITPQSSTGKTRTQPATRSCSEPEAISRTCRATMSSVKSESPEAPSPSQRVVEAVNRLIAPNNSPVTARAAVSVSALGPWAVRAVKSPRFAPEGWTPPTTYTPPANRGDNWRPLYLPPDEISSARSKYPWYVAQKSRVVGIFKSWEALISAHGDPYTEKQIKPLGFATYTEAIKKWVLLRETGNVNVIVD